MRTRPVKAVSRTAWFSGQIAGAAAPVAVQPVLPPERRARHCALIRLAGDALPENPR
jgi:hypothetical protein